MNPKHQTEDLRRRIRDLALEISQLEKSYQRQNDFVKLYVRMAYDHLADAGSCLCRLMNEVYPDEQAKAVSPWPLN